MENILIAGGGFAGLSAALNAVDEFDRRGGGLGVTMVAPSPYITIRPRLYEEDPESLREPLRPVLDPVGVRFVEGAVRAIDAAGHTVTVEKTEGGEMSLAYEKLILATGSELGVLPVPGVAEYSFDIDSFETAVVFDAHLHETVQSPEAPGHDTFVIVGAGMTGIELAAEMRRRIEVHSDARTAAKAHVILIERAEVVGPEMGPGPRPTIEAAMRATGVDLRLGVGIAEIAPDWVSLSDGSRIETATTVIATGMRANALTEQIAAPRDDLGRLIVDEMQRVQGVADLFATGDVARARIDDAHVALMSCQHAMTMGKYAGYNAARELLDLPPRPYRQYPYTNCLDLGSFGAVYTKGWDRVFEASGEVAKKRKRWINAELISPPTGSRAEILAGLRIDEETSK